jgi:hypothetical protein
VLSVVHKAVPEPRFPQIEEQSISGGSEKQPALEGTPEFRKYRDDMREYRRQLTERTMQFYINYGVVGWQLSEDVEYLTMPPKDWEVDDILKMYGETTATDPALRRYQYLSYVLILTQEDADLIELAIGVRADSDSQPVTNEEVQAAIAPFESGTPETVQ